MELYDESELREKRKNKKIANIILALIILIVVIIIALLIAIIAVKKDTLTVYVNGSANDNLKSILLFEDDNAKIYIPIKKIASYFGYNSYNGDYDQPSEDTSKCYVQSENEVATFSLNENTIYKIIPNSTSEYEYFQIDEPVKAINGELYTTVDGIEKAFNVSFSKNNNKIEIYTMDYLISYYTNIIINYGYTSIHTDFNNGKTILDNMLIVEKNKKYGVITPSGEIVLDAKYDDIKYLQHTSDFLVTSNNKVGIISKNKQTKVNVTYDDIQLMDYDSNLYMVKQDGKYGVIDINGNIKVYPEYNKIGIDTKSFKYNNIKNGYIILDTLIPVQKDKLWGLFDKSGKQVVDFKYDSLGYVQNISQNTNNLLVIPDYNMIVIEKDDKYNLIALNGDEIFNVFVDGIYMNIESGISNYYMIYNGQNIELLPYLERYKPSKSTNNNQTENNTTDNAVNNITSNTIDETTNNASNNIITDY